MHRLLVESDQLESDAPALSKDAQAHLRVLRPKEGELFELFDGKGKWRTFSFLRDKNVASPLVPAESDVCTAPRPPSLTLFACVTKGSRWDWTIEKATELGVTRIVPVISDHTIVRIAPNERAAKRERWMRIAEDAARQSDAKWLPEIHEPITFAESLALVKETKCFIGALTNPPPPMIATSISPSISTSTSSLHLSLYVGPEGDFTAEELAALIAIATPVSFGSTILRAETAAIYGLSVLKSHLDAADALSPTNN